MGVRTGFMYRILLGVLFLFSVSDTRGSWMKGGEDCSTIFMPNGWAFLVKQFGREEAENKYKQSFDEFIQHCKHQRKRKREIRPLSKEIERVALYGKLLEITGAEGIDAGLQNGMIQTLLEMGAPATCIKGEKPLFNDATPLCNVISSHCTRIQGRQDYTKSIQALLQAGAQVLPDVLFKAVSEFHLACRKQRMALVKMLLMAKADVNAQGKDAVFSLSWRYDEEEEACDMFKVFVAHAHPKPDLSSMNPHTKETILQNSLRNGRDVLCALLIAAGADYSDVQEPKRSGLLLQAKERSRELMNLNIVQRNIETAGVELQ